MDAHVKQAEELFSAARSEFKRLEYFYFHNCIYEHVWKDNIRRMREVTPTWDILHKFASDYRVVIVGDAAMSPYEVAMRGGSVEHWNEEPGAVWLQRLTERTAHHLLARKSFAPIITAIFQMARSSIVPMSAANR